MGIKKQIQNSIAGWVMGKYSFIGRDNGTTYLHDFNEDRQEFATVIYLNIVELLTEITNDVTLILKRGDVMLFSELNVFFNKYGQEVLNELFTSGFSVIVYDGSYFKLLTTDEFNVNAKGQVTVTNPNFKNSETYVMKSDTYRMSGRSDKAVLSGFLKYLDNVMNASNTTTARLGTLIMASPKQSAGLPTEAKFTDIEKTSAEKDISENYGSLSTQKQILIWRKAMDFSTINLSALDSKTIDKAKFAIEAICDRLKVPSSQVSMIDASSGSNGLSNGGEIREGDLLKYKAFERLLNKTFIRMANDLDLIVDYEIYNKPVAKAEPIKQF